MLHGLGWVVVRLVRRWFCWSRFVTGSVVAFSTRAFLSLVPLLLFYVSVVVPGSLVALSCCAVFVMALCCGRRACAELGGSSKTSWVGGLFDCCMGWVGWLFDWCAVGSAGPFLSLVPCCFSTCTFWSLVPLLLFLHVDRKSTRLNSSHIQKSRMPSSA